MRKLTLLIALGFSACTGSPASPGVGGDAGGAGGDGGAVTAQGHVVDSDTGQPLGGTIVIVEIGGLYQTNPDTSKGNPFYRVSALVGGDGAFSAPVPAGQVGFHTFQDGYFYGVFGPSDAAAANIVIKAKPLLPLDRKPVASNLKITPATAPSGASVVISADVAKAAAIGADAGAGDSGAPAPDPLSEEIIAAETTTHWAAILDPPSPGIQGTGFPDGHYSRTISAPSTPGIYRYHLVVSSEGCVTSDRLTATLTVQ